MSNLKDQLMQAACRADNLIEYPTDFPLKIMGAAHDDFASTVTAVIIEHDPEFHEGKLSMRPSSKGNYIGLTAIVRATSHEQLDNIYRALTSHPMVKIVI